MRKEVDLLIGQFNGIPNRLEDPQKRGLPRAHTGADNS